MNLHQRCHSKIRGEFAIRPHLRCRQDCGNQKDGICAMRGRFNHVIFTDREVLAQGGQPYSRARRLQIVQPTLEEPFFR